MKQKFLLKAMLLLCALIAGSSSVWATDQTAGYTPSAALSSTTGTVTGTANETWSYSITFHENSYYGYGASYGWQIGAGDSGGHKRGCKAFSISTSDITGTITKIEVEAGSYQGNSKINVTVGGNDFGTQNQSTYSGQGASKSTFTGNATGEIIISATDAVRAFYLKSITVTYSTGSSSAPSISASNVEIAQDATNGSIAYTLNNATGNVSASVTSGDWITLGTITASAVPFTCSANTGAQRTAQVTLSFTGATDKVVTITQAAKTVAAPDFNLEGNKRYWQGTEITLTSAGNTIYYTITTDGSTPGNPTNASTEYTAPIVLGSVTTKIKAIAYDSYGNASGVTTRTFTGVAPATLPFSWDEKATATTGIICSTGVGTYSSSPYLKISETGQNVILKIDEVPGTLTFDIKGNDFSGGTFKVQTSADGETYSDLKEYTSLGDKTTETFILANTVRYIKWIYTKKSSGNVALGKINLTSTITLTPAKTYTTLTSAKDLDFTSVSSNLKAYIATEVNAGSVQMTQVNKVPANTGLVLKATTPGSAVNVPVFDGTGADDVSANKMAGSATATTAVAENDGYILKDGVFQPATAGTLPAGKAYLNIAVSAPTLNLDFGETTGVNEVRGQKEEVSGEVYNLAGQRVAQPTKGLYIVNGRKVVIK